MKSGRNFALVALAMTALPLGAQDSFDPFAAMSAREIGPAGMSGRVADVEVVLSDPNIIYVGSSTGGLFKSDDGGIEWDPVFGFPRTCFIDISMLIADEERGWSVEAFDP